MRILPLLLLLLGLCSCAADTQHKIIVSTADQKLLLLEKGKRIGSYPVSTSKFGVGDRYGSYATPLGKLVVDQKIGSGKPLGSVFKDRKATGEVLRPNAPGRDPIITRILWLRGKEGQNRNAYARCIYIHGTPEEAWLGRPRSYGCIRMSSKAVAQVYDVVGRGAEVEITNRKLQS